MTTTSTRDYLAHAVVDLIEEVPDLADAFDREPVRSNPFVPMAYLAAMARATILPKVSDEHVRIALGAKFDELARDIEFIDVETRRYRS